MEHHSDYGDDIPGLPASMEATVPGEFWLQFLRNQQIIIAQNEQIMHTLQQVMTAMNLRQPNSQTTNPQISQTTNPINDQTRHRWIRERVIPEKLQQLLPLLNQLEWYCVKDSDLSGEGYVFDKKECGRQAIYQILRDIKPLLRVTTRAFLQYFTDHSNLGNTYNTVKSGFYYK